MICFGWLTLQAASKSSCRIKIHHFNPFYWVFQLFFSSISSKVPTYISIPMPSDESTINSQQHLQTLTAPKDCWKVSSSRIGAAACSNRCRKIAFCIDLPGKNTEKTQNDYNMWCFIQLRKTRTTNFSKTQGILSPKKVNCSRVTKSPFFVSRLPELRHETTNSEPRQRRRNRTTVLYLRMYLKSV